MGIEIQREIVDDEINNWKLIDSAGYSIPYNGSTVNMFSSARADNYLESNRYTGYFQKTSKFIENRVEYYFTTGIRFNYWDLNEQLLVSPRFSLGVVPDWEKDISFHFSSGLYYQAPFYKELRNKNGEINEEIKAQKSFHVLAGSEYNFNAFNRMFKLSSEIYYKRLNHLIPYKIDNVRIIYSGENIARGYATGIDLKINGEFVKGTDSWASLSIMRTKEDIKEDRFKLANGQEISPGYYRRPTDQLVNFSMFFQDYLPGNPTYKVHLTFHYGSNLPTSPPESDRYDIEYRIPKYIRVDVGFSKELKGQYSKPDYKKRSNAFKSIWLSAEVLNLFGIDNTMSYSWLKTVSNTSQYSGMFAVPNYLTSRRLNVKLTAKF